MNHLFVLIRQVFYKLFKVSILAAIIGLFINISVAEAFDLSSLDASQMLIRLSESIPNLMRLVTATAYVMGFVFLIRGIMALKHVGESRTMMSREHSMREPLVLMFVGTALVFLPSFVQTGTSTFWTNPAVFSYEFEESSPWGELYKAIRMIIELIGAIAVIRGLVILAQLSQHGGGGQGGFGRGLTHIIGGILCINLTLFIDTITTTLF